MNLVENDQKRIDVGNRIQEILDENKQKKQSPKSMRELSNLLGHSSTTKVFHIIHGTYVSNLSIDDYQQIAGVLDMSLDDLLELDVHDVKREINRITHSKLDPDLAIQIIENRISKARGITEKFRWLHEKGLVLNMLSRFEESQIVFELAWKLAKKIKHKADDAIQHTMIHLSYTYFRMGNMDKFKKLLDETEKLTTNPEVLAGVFFQRGNYASKVLKDELVMNMWYERAIFHFEQINDQATIGRIYHNYAEYYFHANEYSKSIDYHRKARNFNHLDTTEQQVISDKDYAKSLFVSGNVIMARDIIEARMKDKSFHYYIEQKAKLLLLYAKITNDVEALKTVLSLKVQNSLWHLVAADMYLEITNKDLQDNSGKIAYSIVRASCPQLHQKNFYEVEDF